jgi:tetratricopeptide (TPR) repeat protein
MWKFPITRLHRSSEATPLFVSLARCLNIAYGCSRNFSQYCHLRVQVWVRTICLWIWSFPIQQATSICYGPRLPWLDLGKRFPEDTLVKFKYLPTIHAQLALNRSDFLEAISTLQLAAPYELGLPGGGAFSPTLYPVYVRGKAYLAAHRSNEAANEFQKIVNHRSIVQNEAIGALAHLQIGRAYATQGDTAKAKTAYQDFLTLWKDADPDIPILIAAKAEYAKLK